MKESFCTYTKRLFAEKVFREFFGEFLTEEVENKFKEDWHYDYIKEMLESHDVDGLIAKLKTLYGKNIARYYKLKRKPLDIIRIEFDSAIVLDAFKDDNRVKNALHYYNYFITKTIEEECVIFIEPTFSEEITDEEFQNCKGIFYHITTSHIVANKIVAHGLIPKASSEDDEAGGYRTFPERAYLIGFKNQKNVDDKLKRIAPNVVNDPANCSIVKINLNRSYVKLYKDLSMSGRNDCYFTYSRIWKGCISFYKDYKNL